MRSATLVTFLAQSVAAGWVGSIAPATRSRAGSVTLQLAVPNGRSDGFDDLRDDLMKRAVHSLLLSLSAQRGVQLWLGEKYSAFLDQHGPQLRGCATAPASRLRLHCAPLASC